MSNQHVTLPEFEKHDSYVTKGTLSKNPGKAVLFRFVHFMATQQLLREHEKDFGNL